MKAMVLIALCALVTACSSVKPNHIRQIEMSSEYSATFCRGEKLKNFSETTYYHAFTCDDGSYFFLLREDGQQ